MPSPDSKPPNLLQPGKPFKPKVLIVAYLCNPEWHSVPLVGWNHAAALAEEVDVHLVTHTWNRPAIARSSWPKDRVTFVSLGFLDRFMAWATHAIFKEQWGKASYTLFNIPFHWLFEFLTWKIFRERLAKKEFDLVHRLTPVSPVHAGPLAKRCHAARVPFLFGPINGGLPWPPGYRNALVKEREWISSLRFLFHVLPFIRSSRQAAAAILVGSRTTWQDLPQKYRAKAFYVPENGIHAAQIALFPAPEPGTARASDLLRVAFLGRLVPLKGVDMVLLAATPLIKEKKMTVDIIGEGSERAYLENLVHHEGISAGVKFHGELPNAAALKMLASMDVFAFPSIREFGGGAVIEAMALGVVPVVIDYGGPGEIVDDASGIRLPLEDDERTIKRLTAAFAGLHADRENLDAKRAAARSRITGAWTWQAKAAITVNIYRYLLDSQSPRPRRDPPAARAADS